MNRQRMVDTTIHKLSGPQVLEQVLSLFKESRSEAVYLLAERHQGESLICKVRVELSRLRKKCLSEGLPFSHFGFTDESIGIVLRVNGVDKEAFMLKFHMTPLQVMKNQAGSVTELEFTL